MPAFLPGNSDVPRSPSAISALWRRPRWQKLAGFAAAPLIIAVGATLWLSLPVNEAVGDRVEFASAVRLPKVELSQSPRLSVVVLPFQNLSGDQHDDYLAEGITDDLTTDLSHISEAFVIARESAYTYKGKATDVRQIGRELGVRYVVEGSVHRLGDVYRVNAQLVATETGAHLWADRFDQQLKELSAGQEEIVRRIGQTLNVAVTEVESARGKRERPTQPDAFDLILRARSHRDHAQEDADFGVTADNTLHENVAGPTPTTVRGATTIRTADLERLLAERNAIVIDPLMYSWGRSIPGAVGLKFSGLGGSVLDAAQDSLRRKMHGLTAGDLNRPIVAAGWNSERFDGRNLALRLVAIGYTNVYWYRGGREAWEVNGLPETKVDVQDW